MAKHLRNGFTTGTAAAAAAKAALLMLITRKAVQTVPVELLTGEVMEIPIKDCRVESDSTAICTVVKDAGDDPDVTHRAVIGARVTCCGKKDSNPVLIRGGEGVGTVTKPGLEVAPGEPAINPGPRRMIASAIHEVLKSFGVDHTLEVEIFVPEGKGLAKKTLNQRLGILGGISILGTTGLVKPMSHEAYVATIRASLSVADAMGLSEVVMTTGRRSERYAQALLAGKAEEAFVQIGDYFKLSLEMAAERAFQQLVLAVFFGKAIKMAEGIPHTHAARSSLTMDHLAQWIRQDYGDNGLGRAIGACNTAREALSYLQDGHLDVVFLVGARMIQAAGGFAGRRVSIRGIIFDYDGKVIFDSNHERCQRYRNGAFPAGFNGKAS